MRMLPWAERAQAEVQRCPQTWPPSSFPSRLSTPSRPPPAGWCPRTCSETARGCRGMWAGSRDQSSSLAGVSGMMVAETKQRLSMKKTTGEKCVDIVFEIIENQNVHGNNWLGRRTFAHQLVDLGRTALGAWHAVSRHQLFQHREQVHPGVWRFAVRGEFP
jgi:hypothetical protein